MGCHLQTGESIITIQKVDYHPAAQSLESLDNSQGIFVDFLAVSESRSQEVSLDVVWDESSCTCRTNIVTIVLQ
jgi:hypothetical protein